MHWAAEIGHTVVQALIAADANVNQPDNNGGTPLHNATYYGHQEATQALIAAGAKLISKIMKVRLLCIGLLIMVIKQLLKL